MDHAEAAGAGTEKAVRCVPGAQGEKSAPEKNLKIFKKICQVSHSQAIYIVKGGNADSMDEHKRSQQYAYLEQLSLEELEGIICADAKSEEHQDTDFIYAVLEVIDEKERKLPGYQPVDVEKSWQEFQRYCANREKWDAVQPRPPMRLAWKRAIAVMAAVVAAVGLVLTVQAAGVDIFGAVAHWTDDVFGFTWVGGKELDPERPAWAEALIEQGVDANLIPTEIPDGYVAGELTVDDLVLWKEFHQSFSSVGNDFWGIRIILYADSEYLQTSVYEKDKSLVEVYEYGQGMIYTFSNINENKVIYLDNLAEVCIAGNLSLNELKQILESIGGIAP